MILRCSSKLPRQRNESKIKVYELLGAEVFLYFDVAKELRLQHELILVQQLRSGDTVQIRI